MVADHVLVCCANVTETGSDKDFDDTTPTHLSVSISAQSSSQHTINEEDAKGHWIYLWYHMVGVWT